MWLHDEETRSKTQGIHDTDVTEMTYRGITTGFLEVKIRSRNAIRVLLEALQNAVEDEQQYSILGRSDTLTVFVNVDVSGDYSRLPSAYTFELSPQTPRYCFGPQFQQALRQISREQSQLLQAFVGENVHSITKIEFVGKVIPADEQEAFLAVLADAPWTWFDYTNAVGPAVLRITGASGIPDEFLIMVPDPELYAPDGYYIPPFIPPFPDAIWQRLGVYKEAYTRHLQPKPHV